MELILFCLVASQSYLMFLFLLVLKSKEGEKKPRIYNPMDVFKNDTRDKILKWYPEKKGEEIATEEVLKKIHENPNHKDR